MSAYLPVSRRRVALEPTRVQQLLRPLGRLDFGTNPLLAWCSLSSLITATLYLLHLEEVLFLGGAWGLAVWLVPGPVLATLMVGFAMVCRHTPLVDRFFERFVVTRDLSAEALRGEMKALGAGHAVEVDELTLKVRQAWLVDVRPGEPGVWVLAGDDDVAVLRGPLPDVRLDEDVEFVPMQWRVEGLPTTGRILSVSAGGSSIRVERSRATTSLLPGEFRFTNRHQLDPQLAQATLTGWGGYRS